MTIKKHEYDYLHADRYVVLNNDPSLRPVVLKLPKPPPLHLIDGYGVDPKEQRFARMKIPRKLIDLEAEAVVKATEELASQRSTVVTPLKVQKKYWSLLKERHKTYKNEIDFIRKMWWHRVHGYWFFNRGKPTYITGKHFYYPNAWTMDTSDAEPRPSYRDRDRKEFVYIDYCLTSTETFAKLDSEGVAIPEEDGSYKMTDVERRICFGKIQPKNRRSGNTNKALAVGLEIVSRTFGTDGGGIQSYSNDNAEEHFKVKLLPAFYKLPMFWMPYTTSTKTSDILKFDVSRSEFFEEGLSVKYTYATTASEKFYDGKKLVFMLLDESGKTSSCSVLKRHDVNKNCLAQGNGRLIHGYMEYPSTVDEMTDGAFDYRFLANTSDFYQRIKASGQTFSGLFRLFIPATEGLDGFIDSYGYSVADKIEDYQKEEGFKQTAYEYLQGKRDVLLAKGDAESMRAYREEKKLFPMRYDDCWLGEAGDIGFDMEKIDTRMAELRRKDDSIVGRLEWAGGTFGGDVYFVEDDENGRFRISKKPPESVSNKKVMISSFSTFEQANVDMYRPMYPGMFTLGADPYNFNNKQNATIGKSLGKKSRLSDGGISVLWNYDPELDSSKPVNEWESYRFVLTYRHRGANSDEFNEDVLKAAIYFGAMVYPEVNLTTTYEYFIRHRFGGYLLYDIDKYTGRFKDKPGWDSEVRSKKDLFTLLREYISTRCHKEEHVDLLRELKEIRGIEEMRHYDLLASAAGALLGAKSSYVDVLKRMENADYDLDDFLM